MYLNLVIILLILVGCSNSKIITQADKKRTVDVSSYLVNVPAGDWNVKINSRRGEVQFFKQPKSVGGGKLPITMIQVSYNWVAKEEMWHLSADEIADAYRDDEIGDMFVNGVLMGNYSLHDTKKDTIILDEKKLYTLSYTQTGGKFFGEDKINECILYMYFPQNFKETHRFYLFLINVVNKRDKQAATDLTPILSIIKSFRLK